MNVKVSDCLAPHFKDLHRSIRREEYSEYWLRGGRGSTKSSAISIEIVLGVMKDPEANAVCFRRYENNVGDSVYAQVQWAVNILGVEHLWRFTRSPFRAIYKPTGQLIVFKGADDPTKVKSIKIPKGYIKFAWFEEVDQFAGMENLRNLGQSLFRGTDKKQIAFYSYNPPRSARSWVNAETRITKEGRFVSYSDFRTVPKEWLGEKFLADAEHLRLTNEDAYRHEYLGEEVGTGLEVFNNVVIREIPDHEIGHFDNHYQGLDFGFAADPLCFEQMHFDSKHRRLYIFHEISGHGIKNSVFAQRLTSDQRQQVTMADAAEPKSIEELRADYNLNIMASVKGPGSIEQGIKWLQDLNEIIIDPKRCPLAAKEFVNYALQVNKQGDVISKYPDKDNHSIDSVRYGCNLLIRQARADKKRNKFKFKSIPVISRW